MEVEIEKAKKLKMSRQTVIVLCSVIGLAVLVAAAIIIISNTVRTDVNVYDSPIKLTIGGDLDGLDNGLTTLGTSDVWLSTGEPFTFYLRAKNIGEDLTVDNIIANVEISKEDISCDDIDSASGIAYTDLGDFLLTDVNVSQWCTDNGDELVFTYKYPEEIELDSGAEVDAKIEVEFDEAGHYDFRVYISTED